MHDPRSRDRLLACELLTPFIKNCSHYAKVCRWPPPCAMSLRRWRHDSGARVKSVKNTHWNTNAVSVEDRIGDRKVHG